MSLKGIEMQIALPRTQDAGKLLEQMEQRNQIAGHYAAGEVRKDEKKKQTTVAESAKGEKASRRHSKEEQGRGKGGGSENHGSAPEPDHPYKGRSIDFSG